MIERPEFAALQQKFEVGFENGLCKITEKMTLDDVRMLIEALKINAKLPSNSPYLITTLDLSGTEIGSEEVTLIADSLQDLPQIKLLDLSSNRIGNIGLINFANVLKKNNSLESLNLSNVEALSILCVPEYVLISNVGKLALAISENTRLKHVYFNQCWRSTDSPEILVPLMLKGNNTLQSIHIQFGSVGEEDLRDISSQILTVLKSNTSLIYLGIGGKERHWKNFNEINKCLEQNKEAARIPILIQVAKNDVEQAKKLYEEALSIVEKLKENDRNVDHLKSIIHIAMGKQYAEQKNFIEAWSLLKEFIDKDSSVGIALAASLFAMEELLPCFTEPQKYYQFIMCLLKSSVRNDPEFSAQLRLNLIAAALNGLQKNKFSSPDWVTLSKLIGRDDVISIAELFAVVQSIYGTLDMESPKIRNYLAEKSIGDYKFQLSFEFKENIPEFVYDFTSPDGEKTVRISLSELSKHVYGIELNSTISHDKVEALLADENIKRELVKKYGTSNVAVFEVLLNVDNLTNLEKELFSTVSDYVTNTMKQQEEEQKKALEELAKRFDDFINNDKSEDTLESIQLAYEELDSLEAFDKKKGELKSRLITRLTLFAQHGDNDYTFTAVEESFKKLGISATFKEMIGNRVKDLNNRLSARLGNKSQGSASLKSIKDSYKRLSKIADFHIYKTSLIEQLNSDFTDLLLKGEPHDHIINNDSLGQNIDDIKSKYQVLGAESEFCLKKIDLKGLVKQQFMNGSRSFQWLKERCKYFGEESEADQLLIYKTSLIEQLNSDFTDLLLKGQPHDHIINNDKLGQNVDDIKSKYQSFGAESEFCSKKNDIKGLVKQQFIDGFRSFQWLKERYKYLDAESEADQLLISTVRNMLEDYDVAPDQLQKIENLIQNELNKIYHDETVHFLKQQILDKILDYIKSKTRDRSTLMSLPLSSHHMRKESTMFYRDLPNNEHSKLIAKIEDLLEQGNDGHEKEIAKFLGQIDNEAIRVFYLGELWYRNSKGERKQELENIFSEESHLIFKNNLMLKKYFWARYILLTENKEHKDEALRVLRKLATEKKFTPAYYLLATCAEGLRRKYRYLKEATLLSNLRAPSKLCEIYLNEKVEGKTKSSLPLNKPLLLLLTKKNYQLGYPTAVKTVNDFLQAVVRFLSSASAGKEDKARAIEMCNVAAQICPDKELSNLFISVRDTLKAEGSISEERLEALNNHFNNEYVQKEQKAIYHKLHSQTAMTLFEQRLSMLKERQSKICEKIFNQMMYSGGFFSRPKFNDDHETSILQYAQDKGDNNFISDQKVVTYPDIKNLLSELKAISQEIEKTNLQYETMLEHGDVENLWNLSDVVALRAELEVLINNLNKRTAHHQIYAKAIRSIIDSNTDNYDAIVRQISGLKLYRQVETKNHQADFLLDKLNQILKQFPLSSQESKKQRLDCSIDTAPEKLITDVKSAISSRLFVPKILFMGGGRRTIENNYVDTLAEMIEADTSDTTLCQQIKALEVMRSLEMDANSNQKLKKDFVYSYLEFLSDKYDPTKQQALLESLSV